MRRAVGVVVAVWLSWLAVGCTSGSGSATRGTQCDQIMQDLCTRATDDCQLFPPEQLPDCIESGMISCCAGNCAATAVSTQQQIDTCILDIGEASCATLDTAAGGPLPATCRHVVQSVPGV
jgi:hypothetical protein